jgi:Na+/melibiose symporter-like transporter
MTDQKKSPFVTRAEFYGIAGSIYLLLALGFLQVARSDGQSVLNLIAVYLFFGVAIVSSVFFSILAIRERQQRPNGRGDAAGPEAG